MQGLDAEIEKVDAKQRKLDEEMKRRGLK